MKGRSIRLHTETETRQLCSLITTHPSHQTILVLRPVTSYCKDLARRKRWDLRKPPAWVKTMKRNSLKLQVLEQGITSKKQALALEALHAARKMVGFPYLAWGGPWVQPTLQVSALAPQLKAVAARRSLLAVQEWDPDKLTPNPIKNSSLLRTL